jgi:hypothetical protein
MNLRDSRNNIAPMETFNELKAYRPTHTNERMHTWSTITDMSSTTHQLSAFPSSHKNLPFIYHNVRSHIPTISH